MMALINIDGGGMIIFCGIALLIEYVWVIPEVVECVDQIRCNLYQYIRTFIVIYLFLLMVIIIAHSFVVIGRDVFKLCDIGMIFIGASICRMVVCAILLLKLGST
jgi:hypothetical protein